MSAAVSDIDYFGARTSGRITRAAPLAPHLWFRAGGPADALVQPTDVADLGAFLASLPPEIPVMAIGAGSNLIVRDGGIAGAVIKLGKSAAHITPDGDGLVVGGAAADALVARRAAEQGIAGLEFLTGIPGLIGGAIAMNAGAYGGEIADILDWAEIVARDGALHRLESQNFRFGYRHCSGLPPGAIVVRARLRGRSGDPETIASCIADIRSRREASQPVKERTGGSTFRNPDPSVSSLKAWELIDQAGCRALRVGAAEVSARHTNFLVNTGGATAADIETLGETVRARVMAQFGIDLHWEIKRVGVPT